MGEWNVSVASVLPAGPQLKRSKQLRPLLLHKLVHQPPAGCVSIQVTWKTFPRLLRDTSDVLSAGQFWPSLRERKRKVIKGEKEIWLRGMLARRDT